MSPPWAVRGTTSTFAAAPDGADGSHGVYPVDLAFSPLSPLVLGGEVSDAPVAQVRSGGAIVESLPCPAAATTSRAPSPPRSRSRTPRCWPAWCSRSSPLPSYRGGLNEWLASGRGGVVGLAGETGVREFPEPRRALGL